MKILVSCDDYCYKYKGDYYLRDFGITLVNRYLMAFDKVRFVVRTKEVYSKEDLNRYKIKIDSERVEIVPVPFFQGPKQYAKVFFKTKNTLRDVAEGCDIACLRLPSTTAFAVWTKIKNKIPYFVEVVADCHDLYTGARSLLHKSLWYRMHVKMVDACNHAIGVSCVTRDYLQQHYTSKLPGAIFSHYSSVEMLSSFRYQARTYPQKKQHEIILVANQVYLNSGKGHRLAIDALKLLKEKQCVVTLTLVGGDYFGGINDIKAYAESLGVADQIEFTGFINSVQLKECLKKADILILPTHAEGLPRVIIEALALGLPCVTTPVSGNPELIDKEFLVNYDDAEGFANKIITLIKDEKLYEQQSKVNFERSHEYCKDVLDERRKNFFLELKQKIN